MTVAEAVEVLGVEVVSGESLVTLHPAATAISGSADSMAKVFLLVTPPSLMG